MAVSDKLRNTVKTTDIPSATRADGAYVLTADIRTTLVILKSSYTLQHVGQSQKTQCSANHFYCGPVQYVCTVVHY